MTQGELFDGFTFEPTVDEIRLATQLERVRELMVDGGWRTLEEIAAVCGGSITGISARLRDLRKPRFGSHVVSSRRRGGAGGTWEYRITKGGTDVAATV